ncbi:MAG: putative potassium transport system protein kup 1 [Saprospiraceae bacterium]|nr:MAG: putative potassium transport system protein kup 1 [Saprospiraceae bacterium]
MKKHQTPGKPLLLTFAALGVVYGDIGTSPLYALRECFYGEHSTAINDENVLGILSLIFWSLVLIISLKYLLLILRADNQGEGGILALMHLILPEEGKKPRQRTLILMLGLFGAALLYGDGILTPAISVLSAVEGLQIIGPHLDQYIVPITVVILFGLFGLQKYGTGRVGTLFSPIMLVWFISLSILGIAKIIQTPEVLAALNPFYAVSFLWREGWMSLFVLGAVFLVVTGGEALYADMGHFGRKPIQQAWFMLVLPSLLLNYFGQGALLLNHPEWAVNPFYHLAPSWALTPLIILSTLATIIASQAIISGAFSLTFQAVQLNYLPRLKILHTSKIARGQVFLPKVNRLLLVATIGVVLMFQTSANLAVAYGIAITVTMLITDILAFHAMRRLWHWKRWIALPITLLFLLVDLAFFSANALKIVQGGWFPLLIAFGIFFAMRTWIKGRKYMGKQMAKFSQPLHDFVAEFDRSKYLPAKGTAIYMSASILNTPVALIHNLQHNQVIHKRVIFLEIGTKNQPRVASVNRITVDDMGKGFYRVLVKYGYSEVVNMKNILRTLKQNNFPKLKNKDLTFFLSRQTLIANAREGLTRLEDSVFIFLRSNSTGATRYYQLPVGRVFEVGVQVVV